MNFTRLYQANDHGSEVVYCPPLRNVWKSRQTHSMWRIYGHGTMTFIAIIAKKETIYLL